MSRRRMPLALALAITLAAAPNLAPAAAQSGRLPVLVLTGEDLEHDWRWTSTNLRGLLEDTGRFRVEVEIWPGATLSDPTSLARYRLLVVDYDGARWGAEEERSFLEAIRAGAGVLILHSAHRAFPDWDGYQDLIGGPWTTASTHDLVTPVRVQFEDRIHAVSSGLEAWDGHVDGLLSRLDLNRETHHVLAHARSDAYVGGSDADEPVIAIGRYGEGRVFQTTLGHVGYGDESSWESWRDPRFEQLLIRAAQWAATGEVRPLVSVAPNTLTAADRAAGWRLLFDGHSLEGWTGFGDGTLAQSSWVVEDGCLKLLSGGDGLTTGERFDEFEMELEWRVDRESAAAAAVRLGLADEEGGSLDLPLLEDDHALFEARVALGVDPEAARVLRPPGEFNHVRIVALGGRVEHWLNGIRFLTLDTSSTAWAEAVRSGSWKEDPDLARTPLARLALSGAGVDVWFRNVKIRQLPPPLEDLAAPRAPIAPEAIPLFPTADLSGWQQEWWDQEPYGLWRFEDDGVLVCEGFALAYLRTMAEYEDFLLELDYRFDPVTRQGGQGGILIRMQGGGFYPPCLEVRLQRRDAGSIWQHEPFPFTPDPRRTNGRVTQKLVDAENDLGEWNRLAIRAEGGQLTVHLNGELVNELGGLDAVPGGIAIKSEGVRMHYRDVRLTPLR